MSRRSGGYRALAVGCMLAATVSGCGSITGGEKYRLEGVYELQTVLDTLSFETTNPYNSIPDRVPGCETALMYCTLHRPMAEATLGGALALTGGPGPTGTAAAQTNGRFCEAHDWRVPSGCTLLGPATDRDYPYGSVTITTWAGNEPDSVVIRLGRAGPVDQTMATLHLSGRLVGSDIVGSVYWRLVGGRSPPSHRGTFTARLVR